VDKNNSTKQEAGVSRRREAKPMSAIDPKRTLAQTRIALIIGTVLNIISA
jgi:hypothetical protein